eukprot:2365890-Alexandrium_andersonii.AAC.1
MPGARPRVVPTEIHPMQVTQEVPLAQPTPVAARAVPLAQGGLAPPPSQATVAGDATPPIMSMEHLLGRSAATFQALACATGQHALSGLVVPPAGHPGPPAMP